MIPLFAQKRRKKKKPRHSCFHVVAEPWEGSLTLGPYLVHVQRSCHTGVGEVTHQTRAEPLHFWVANEKQQEYIRPQERRVTSRGGW